VTDLPALDVAIGLAFIYFLLAVLASAVIEAVSSLLNLRANALETWIKKLLGPDAATNVGSADTREGDPPPQNRTKQQARDDAQARVDAFYSTGVIRALSLGSTRKPSYIPSQHAINAILKDARIGLRAGETEEQAWERIDEEIKALPPSHARDALLEIHHRVGSDLTRFRSAAEGWFDDCMERLSGWYRRRVQYFVWGISAVVILVLNVDTLAVAESLWNDPALRSVVTAQAGHASQAVSANDALATVQGLPLPIGWTTPHHRDVQTISYLVVGWLLTFFAVSLGAPFWFDTLSKLGRLRGTGAPPPATGAVRVGEGEQRREGPPSVGNKPTVPV
jgi:hypothetical protein